MDDHDSHEKMMFGKLHKETQVTTQKAKDVVKRLMETQIQQCEKIRRLERLCSSLRAEVTKISAAKETKEELLATTKEKLRLQIQERRELEQLLETYKFRERNLLLKLQEGSKKLERIYETRDSDNLAHSQIVAGYDEQISSNTRLYAELQCQFEKMKTDNTNLLNEIKKVKEAKNAKIKSDSETIAAAYAKQKEKLTGEYDIMLKENLERYEKERRHLEAELEGSKYALIQKSMENDKLLEQKEMILRNNRLNEQGKFSSMQADMEDLRLELVNQVKINGRLKTSFESLQVGTNLKIRSLERKTSSIEGRTSESVLYTSCTEDILKVKQLLAIGCGEKNFSWHNEELLTNQNTNILNLSEPTTTTVLERNSPAFKRSMESALKKKRAFDSLKKKRAFDSLNKKRAFEGITDEIKSKRRRNNLTRNRGRPYYSNKDVKEENCSIM